MIPNPTEQGSELLKTLGLAAPSAFAEKQCLLGNQPFKRGAGFLSHRTATGSGRYTTHGQTAHRDETPGSIERLQFEAFDSFGRRGILDCIRMGCVERKRHRSAPGGLDLVLRGFESFNAADDDPNLGTIAAKLPCSSST